MPTDFHTADIPALIREHGFAKAFEILQARKQQQEPQQQPGDSCELTAEEYKRAIEANKRARTAS